MQYITKSHVYVAECPFIPVLHGTSRSTVKIPVQFVGGFHFIYPLYIKRVRHNTMTWAIK